MNDPLSGSTWSSPAMVAGFAQSPPNDVLMRFAERERERVSGGRAIDIGCGAGRNAVPLARSGWRVLGCDYSWPMLVAAQERARAEGALLDLALAPMQALPIADRSADLVIAHGIWNLARSAALFRAAVREAARVARPGGALFLFTFSRNTLAPGAEPVAGEPFVFTQFSGEPQCFLTEPQLIQEMHAAGFVHEPSVALTEYNLPRPGSLRSSGPPVIFEAAFRLDQIE